jgi:hypothetical protein
LATPEEEEQIAAGIQAGIVKPMEGATPEARKRSLERARQAVQRHSEAVKNAMAQYSRVTFYRDAAAGGLTEIQQIVEQETGLAGDEAAELAKRISRQAKEGVKRLPRVPGGEHMVSDSDVAEWLAKKGVLERVPAESEEPLLRIIRARAGMPQSPLPAPTTQQGSTLIDEITETIRKSGEAAAEISPSELWHGSYEEKSKAFDKAVIGDYPEKAKAFGRRLKEAFSPEAMRRAGRQWEVEMETPLWGQPPSPLPSPSPTTQPSQPTLRPVVNNNSEINYHFHGPTYVGSPGDRFATHERVPQ